MKKAARTWTGGLLVMMVMMVASWPSTAQVKIDAERMERDIEVAENVLGTLIKQKFDQRNYWHMGVEGKYMEGFGVTFRIPHEMSMSFELIGAPGATVIMGDAEWQVQKSQRPQVEPKRAPTPAPDRYTPDEAKEIKARAAKPATKMVWRTDKDSLRQVREKAYYEGIIAASKEFLADYGDFLSQLQPDERIMITNRGEDYRYFYVGSKSARRVLLTLEVTKSDLTQLRQGKITRDHLIDKIRIVNTQSEEELSPDLELLSTIMSRLYRSDLSKTFFTEENIYYERLRDFGVIYYMSVSSSYESDDERFKMPTVQLEDVDKQTRDKKVIEIYPAFEKDIKENLLEYARTLKSLKDDEAVIFNVRLTKCSGCNIPSSLELTVKTSLLKEYAAGTITKDAAMARILVKKGPNQ